MRTCLQRLRESQRRLILERYFRGRSVQQIAEHRKRTAFAAAGKERIAVRMLLDHTAGLPVVDEPLTYEEVLAGEPVVRALAAQKPIWKPGSRHGYHGLTYG